MLEISLLGEQRVALDGSVVDLGSPRAKALLGFLLLHRDVPQRREYVAGQFWPDSTTGQARTNLRRELHTLRTGLPVVTGWLAADRGTLLWRSGPGCQLDVADFEAAAGTAAAARTAGDDTGFRQAAAGAMRAYRGELLPALYDDWVSTERDRLHRMCLLLLDQLIELDRAAGLYQDAIERARQRIDLELLEEVGYRTLLQVQALAGDRAAALQTYHRCVSVLERELGVAPDRATIAEYERLAGPGPGPAGAAAHDADGPDAGAPGAGQAQRPAISTVRLVGREQEFQLLQRRWRETLAGTAGLAVLSGEAGIGKTRLIDELSAAVRRAGFLAPRARCFAARGRLALAPVSEWLRSPPLHAARARLDPVWSREVDRLVPPRDTRPAAPPRPMADAWQRHRFFEGLARAVLSAARPTLLVLDDLQWCDEDTLAWLQLLLHLGQDQPLLVLAATRRDEVAANAELSEMLRVLRSAGQLTEINVAPLDPARSRQLAGQVLGRKLATAEAELLHATTGGYPLFVIEAVRAGLLDRTGSAVPAPGPGGGAPEVRSVLAGRIRQAAPAARATAELAAVIGRDFTLELLAEASDLDSDAVMAAVDELWRRRIIREHAPARYDFCHDLLRDTSYGEISPARRRLLHRRVAQALQAMHGDDPAAAAAIAYHYERADRPAQALPHHVRAAEVASQVFANQKAIRHYRRAPPCSGTCPRATAGTAPSWPSATRWRHRSTRATDTPTPSCRTCWNGPVSWPGSWATATRSCAAWPACSRCATCGATSPSRTRSPAARWPSASGTRTGRGRRTGRWPGRPPAWAGTKHPCRTSSWPTSCAPTSHRRWWAPGSRCTRGPGQPIRCGCSGGRRRRCAGPSGPSPGPARWITRSAWRWRCPTRRSLTSCAATCRGPSSSPGRCRRSALVTTSPTTATGGSSSAAGAWAVRTVPGRSGPAWPGCGIRGH